MSLWLSQVKGGGQEEKSSCNIPLLPNDCVLYVFTYMLKVGWVVEVGDVDACPRRGVAPFYSYQLTEFFPPHGFLFWATEERTWGVWFTLQYLKANALQNKIRAHCIMTKTRDSKSWKINLYCLTQTKKSITKEWGDYSIIRNKISTKILKN